MQLYDYQLDAIHKMKKGCILNGGVGSGKSITSLAYFYLKNGGDESTLLGGDYIPMDDVDMKDLYIITTARKRDTFEWESELTKFLMSPNPEVSLYPTHKVIIDSWNNIQKYRNVTNAFFIFDEQRVVGYGAWSQSFIRIAKNNEWILLSATPGDTWSDYIPVFIANGFYKNKTAFTQEHCVFSCFTKYPKIDRYMNTKRLVRLRDSILIDMDYKRKAIAHHIDIFTDYDTPTYRTVMQKRWNIFDDCPLRDAGDLCRTLRRIVNTDESRQTELLMLHEKASKIIVFYNFDYELEILRNLAEANAIEYTEWNGKKHQPVPNSDSWLYLVQYTAGAEGWNCIQTDTIVFFSQNYSYKIMAQAAGRIDRLNSPYTDLYYYHFKSRSSIDLGISKALNMKKKFNEGSWSGGFKFISSENKAA